MKVVAKLYCPTCHKGRVAYCSMGHNLGKTKKKKTKKRK